MFFIWNYFELCRYILYEIIICLKLFEIAILIILIIAGAGVAHRWLSAGMPIAHAPENYMHVRSATRVHDHRPHGAVVLERTLVRDFCDLMPPLVLGLILGL